MRSERCDGLYLVISGRVTTVKVSPEGREQVLRVFGPGKTVGNIGVFDGGPHAANAQAVRARVVALITVDDFHRVVAEYPAASTAALRYLAGRLRAFTEIVEDISSVWSSHAPRGCCSTSQQTGRARWYLLMEALSREFPSFPRARQ